MPSDPTPKGPSASTPSEDLARFRRGEMTEFEYLQARIDRAIQHLRGRVSLRRLNRIRRLVVQGCASDPVFVGLKERLLRPRNKSGQ
jgi:hypothetical protein